MFVAAGNDTPRIARPGGARDWFIVPSWEEIYARTGIAPGALPGVRTVANHPAAQLAPLSAPEYLKQAGGSAKRPFPYRVHRSHLPVLGYAPPSDWLDKQTGEAPRVLRPHQVDGVAFLRERRGALLADEMRVGKTCQVVYAHEPGEGPLVVVGPVAARAAWHEWAARRFGACVVALDLEPCSICERVGAQPQGAPSFAVLAGRAPDLELLKLGARVLFLTYATVGPWSECFAAFGRIGTLAPDEAHLAGVQNRRNITVIGLRRLNTCAARTVCISGSPMWNMPSGLWPIVDIICPGAFGTFWDFALRYSAAAPGEHGWSTDGASNERELELRLSAIMLRRTWRDIQPDLPPINRAVEYVELSTETHAAVFEAANDLRKAAGLGKPQTVVGNLERLRKLYANVKVARAAEIIRETLANGHSIIAWTWHRDAADALSSALGSEPWVYGPIHGQLTPGAREQILDEVRGDTHPRVLIATMGALGTAVSLNWASHSVVIELDWTPAVHQQADMRCFDGSRPISIVYLVADCAPDRQLADALLAKLEAQSALGLRAGTGDVSAVLATVFGLDPNKTLMDVAEAILAAEQL